MTEQEQQQRAAVVAEVMTWLRTPYHHRAMVKGGGVDCAMLPIAVYSAVGLIERFDPGSYPPDWYMHRDEERYLTYVLQWAHRVEQPQAGDLALFKFGRSQAAHGAIVTEYPTVVHAQNGACVTLDSLQTMPIRDRLTGFYTLNIWGDAP